MRIALIYPGCHRRGGIERVLLECANFLSDRGHEIHLIAADWDETLLRPAIVRHRVPLNFRFPAAMALEFAVRSSAALRAMKPAPDVVGAFGVQCPSGVLWVPSVHRTWINISRQHRGVAGRLKQLCNPFHSVILALERSYFTGRKYKKLLALTHDVRTDLISLYGVPAQDIEILPNGFLESEFNIEKRFERRSEVRCKLGYTESDRVVIFVANELQRKGFFPLIEAVKSLDDPRVKILAVGRLDRAACKKELDRLDLSKRVHFTGPTSDAASYYAAADVFALPTQYEAWGLVIVEAMACGLPVLTSRLAGAAIAVQDGKTGRLLDDPRNVSEITAKLRPLLDGNHASAQEIAASVEQYYWSKIFTRYERALAECATDSISARSMNRAADAAVSTV